MSSKWIGIFVLMLFWVGAVLFFKWSALQPLPIPSDFARMGPFKTSEKMLLGISLSLNEMSQKDWELLPHIGPTLAKKIIAFRQEQGDLQSVQDLLKIKGVGSKTLQKIKPYLNPSLSKN